MDIENLIKNLPINKITSLAYSFPLEKIYLTPYTAYFHQLLKQKINSYDLGEIIIPDDLDDLSLVYEKIHQFLNIYYHYLPKHPLVIIGGNKSTAQVTSSKFLKYYKSNSAVINIQNKHEQLITISVNTTTHNNFVISLREIKVTGTFNVANTIIDNLKKMDVQNIYISIDSRAIGTSYINAFNATDPEEFAPHELAIILNNIQNSFHTCGIDYLESSKAIKDLIFNQGNLQSVLLLHGSFLQLLIDSLTVKT